MNIKQVSPPLDSRARNVAPTLIVLHATAGASARSSIHVLRQKGFSYHYIIARDAKDSANNALADGSDPVVFQCVDDSRQAFHVASNVPTPEGYRINKASIGISLANLQLSPTADSYPTRQLEVLNALIDHVCNVMPSMIRLTTHAVVQPWNRADPRWLDGAQIAAAHGLEWWQPSLTLLAQHMPQKDPV